MKASTHGAPQGFVLFQYGHNAMHACTCFNGCECAPGRLACCCAGGLRACYGGFCVVLRCAGPPAAL